MTMQFISVPEQDYSKGIDARSAENQIEEGYVRDLLNADIVEKRVRKRAGYQGYAGNLPVRVTAMDYLAGTNQISFTLDSAINLDSVVSLEKLRSSPLLVQGRSSTFTTGPFIKGTDNIRYYPQFGIPTRKSFVAPSGTLFISGNEHGLGTTNMFVSVVESTDVISRSYETISANQLRINNTTFDISVDYVTDQSKNVFAYFRDNQVLAGQNYNATLTHTGAGSQVFTIPATTHNLSNLNIRSQFQEVIGGEIVQVLPDQFLILPNGDVQVTFISSTPRTFRVLLAISALGNVALGVVPSQSTGTVTLTGLTTPWVFYNIYVEQTVGGIKELVLADSIQYDDATGSATISFDNEDSVAKSFIVFYDYGNLRSNQLTVVDTSVSVSGSDSSPQISIWGLDHDEMYLDKASREAWVTHIDSYRRSGEQRIISGLGGNLFGVQEFPEASATYRYPTLLPRLNARTNTYSVLAPLFWAAGELPGRSRGYITGQSLGTHWATITSVIYNPLSQFTEFTLSIPNKSVLNSTGTPTSINNVISTFPGLQDVLTVQGMSYKRHQGSWLIQQVIDGTNSITIAVSIPTNSSDYNDSGTSGQAGVFSDQLTWVGNSPFIPGDLLSSEALSNSTVISSTATTTVCDSIATKVEVPGGVVFSAARTSDVIPLRSLNPGSNDSVLNVVRGDMLSYTGIARQVRVLHINPDQNRNLQVTYLGGLLTYRLLTGTTVFLTPGMRILLTAAGNYTGVQTITSITSNTEFTVKSSIAPDSSTAVLSGSTIQIDEFLDWKDTSSDSTKFRVEQRWIPIEAPTDTFSLTPKTYVRHLDGNPYSYQDFLRSTIVADTLFLTNGLDEVQKYDGRNIYRAGLPEWQPSAFLTQETTGATIVTDLRSISHSASTTGDLASGQLQIAVGSVNTLPVGTNVRISGSLLTYIVRGYQTGTTNYILLDRSLETSIGTAIGTISEIGTFRYYFRLNAVDINSNIVASYVSGYQDHVVELTQNAAVQMKLIGLPALDNYDYDRLEVQIYRTKLNQVAPFYLITTIPMSFNNTRGYISFRDSFADSDLTQLDEVNTALKGQELGTQWTGPLRAKHVTSIGNRLVLANLTSFPELDIRIVGSASLSNAQLAGNTYLFRRQNTDVGVTTDMLNRVKYEFVNGSSGTASGYSIGANQFSFTVSGTTPTTIGSWIYLSYDTVATTGRSLDYAGWWQVAAIAGSLVTVNLTSSSAATAYPNKYTIASNSLDVPVQLGADGNLGMFNGDSFDLFDSMRRMSIAINATMRMVDVSLTGYSLFTPWLTARGGNDVSAAGSLLVRAPKQSTDTVELVPTFSNYSLFVNSIQRTSGDQISATTALFPSRLIASYQNYPEIYDNPTTILDTQSQSALDINAADGQEITGILPFFGEAAFGAAQQSGILVVFKTNSIYLVDLNQKALGANAYERIETEGLGCTAPNSIAVTKSGIMFANESGIYCLRRNQSIEYLGRRMERNWGEKVSLVNLDLAHGHHYGVGRSYKLSVPLTGSINASSGYVENSEVYVYNHTAEDFGSDTYGVIARGGWTRYDSHNAIGWANLNSDAFFAGTNGRVYKIRSTGLSDDYRDDSKPIKFVLETRPNSYGNAGIRKVLDKIVVHYRISKLNLGTSVSYSVDLENTYSETTSFELSDRKNEQSVSSPIVTVLHNLERRRGIFFGIEIANAALDEPIEIAGIEYKVGGLSDKGITSAQNTVKGRK